MTVMILTVLGGSVWWILQPPQPGRLDTLLTPTSVKPSPAMPKPSAPKKEPVIEKRPQTEDASPAPAADQGDVASFSPNSTTLGKHSSKRSELRLLELEAAIKEKKVKISKLDESLSENKDKDLVVLAPPPVQIPALPAPVPAPSMQAVRKQVQVVAVEGLNGVLSATVRTASGHLVTLHEGSRFGGGIASISRTGVSIRKGGKTEHLSFE